MARIYIPVTWTQEVNGTTITKTVYYLKADAGVDCAADEAALLALFASILDNASLTINQKVDQLSALFLPAIPANLPGMFWDDRGCGGQFFFETTEADLVVAGGGNPPPVTGDFGGTQIVSSNPSVLAPVISWQNGKARISNGVSPSIPSGQFLFVFVDGQPASSAFSSSYDYYPGDEVSVFIAIATSNDIFQSAFDIKGTASILIGNAPS